MSTTLAIDTEVDKDSANNDQLGVLETMPCFKNSHSDLIKGLYIVCVCVCVIELS